MLPGAPKGGCEASEASREGNRTAGVPRLGGACGSQHSGVASRRRPWCTAQRHGKPGGAVGCPAPLRRRRKCTVAASKAWLAGQLCAVCLTQGDGQQVVQQEALPGHTGHACGNWAGV